MKNSIPPQRIPLNLIDLSYLIPETDDPNGTYFPMSPILTVELNQPLNREHVVEALSSLAEEHPYLCLRYRLSPSDSSLTYVPDSEWATYREKLVQSIDTSTDAMIWLSDAIRTNIMPLSQSFCFYVHGNNLILQMHHSFGDGKFMYVILQHLLAILFDMAIERHTIAPAWRMPMSKLIYQDWQTAVRVWQGFFRILAGEYQNYQRDTESVIAERVPITSGVPQRTLTYTLTQKIMQSIHVQRKKIGVSLNTFLQVKCARVLREMGFLDSPVTYTIPVDLERYLRQSHGKYAGNLASQIRITLDGDIDTHPIRLQEEVKTKLANYTALAGMPGEWLLLASGSKTYRHTNRDWLLKSTHTEPRVFVFSNLGRYDTYFAELPPILATYIHIPLMGAPPLAMSFGTLNEQGLLALTYDPQVFTDDDISAFCHALSDG